MKNIKSIRAAIMLALLSSVFIFAACAKDNGTKLTEKDVVGTWGAVVDDIESTYIFYKNNTYIIPGLIEQRKGTSWSLAYEQLDGTYASYFNLNDKEYVVTIKYEPESVTGKFVLIKNKEGSYLIAYTESATGMNFNDDYILQKIK